MSDARKTCLRWKGVSPSREKYQQALEPFGPFVHLHNGGFDEWVCLYDNEEQPAAALGAIGDPGAHDSPFNLGENKRRDEKRRIAKEKGGMIAFSHLHASVTTAHEGRDPSAYEYDYWDNVEELVSGLEGLLPEAVLKNWDEKAGEMEKCDDRQQSVCGLLLELDGLIQKHCPQIIHDHAEAAMWRKSLQLIQAGEFSMHVDRFANMLPNYVSLLDGSAGNLEDIEFVVE